MTALPRDLEPQIIGAKLRALLGEIEASSPFTNFIKGVAQLTESETAKQEKVYKEVVGLDNKREADKTVPDGIKKTEDNKEKAKEDLIDSAKKFRDNAPEDTKRHYDTNLPQLPARGV